MLSESDLFLSLVGIDWVYHYIIKKKKHRKNTTKFSAGEIIHGVFYWHFVWVSGRGSHRCAKLEEKENTMCLRGHTCKMLAPPCFAWVNKKPSLNKQISDAPGLVTATQICTCEKQRGYKGMPSFLQICHCDFQSEVHGEDLTVIYISFQGIHNRLAPQWTLFSAVLKGDGMSLWGMRTGQFFIGYAVQILKHRGPNASSKFGASVSTYFQETRKFHFTDI